MIAQRWSEEELSTSDLRTLLARLEAALYALDVASWPSGQAGEHLETDVAEGVLAEIQLPLLVAQRRLRDLQKGRTK